MCGAGTYSLANSSSCTLCSPSTYTAFPARSSCVFCADPGLIWYRSCAAHSLTDLQPWRNGSSPRRLVGLPGFPRHLDHAALPDGFASVCRYRSHFLAFGQGFAWATWLTARRNAQSTGFKTRPTHCAVRASLGQRWSAAAIARVRLHCSPSS